MKTYVASRGAFSKIGYLPYISSSISLPLKRKNAIRNKTARAETTTTKKGYFIIFHKQQTTETRVETMDGEEDIGSALANIQELLKAKEKALDEKEAALSRKRKLLQQEFPQSGSDTDVLHLNVGGNTNITVLRRTLTQFEDSMLASKFSGRWDDSLPKDKHGNFFIDEDAEVFLTLVNYLRKREKTPRDDLSIPLPIPSFTMCWMLEYYDLMLSIYSHDWTIIWGNNDELLLQPPNRASEPYVIKTGTAVACFALELGAGKPSKCSTLTCVFERGSVGQIAWDESFPATSSKAGHQTDHGIGLDFEADSFRKSGLTTEPLNAKYRENDQTVRLRCIPLRSKGMYRYTIEVEAEGQDIKMIELECSAPLNPCITVAGKVTVSGLSYLFE